MAFWITFADGTHGCCEGSDSIDAVRIAERLKGKRSTGVASLPYPASPVLWQFEHPVHGKCPTFCYDPAGCAGRSACPRSPSCTS